MRRTIAASAALLAAIGAAAGASALEGAYDVGPARFTVADGTISGVTPEGVAVSDTYVVEGDTITITAPDDHPLCPGAVGVYTFAETETEVSFTLVSDTCELRAQGMTQGAWVKAEEE